MGWTFIRTSRDKLIGNLIAPRETDRACSEVIDHTLVGDTFGNVLWSVVRITAKQAGVMNLAAGESCCFIDCHLLEPSGSEWGYKSLDESMHPYHYSCPLRYLDMAPQQCVIWRARVHAFHEHARGSVSSKAVTE